MNRSGYTILEAVVAMSIFAVGILALSHSYFGIMRSQLNARQQEVATQCARDRMEQILNSMSYSEITEANFPDEDFGDVDDGASMYQAFNRDVIIDATMGAGGIDVMKEVTVKVEWRTPQGIRDVTLNSVVAYYKDITP